MEPVSLVLGFALGYLARGPLNAARVRAKVRREIRSIADDLSTTANTSLDENEPEIQGVGGPMYRPFLQIDDPRYAQVAHYLKSIGVEYCQGPEFMLVSRVITPLQSEVLYRIAMRSGLNFYRDDTDDIVIAPQGMMDIQSPIGVGALTPGVLRPGHGVRSGYGENRYHKGRGVRVDALSGLPDFYTAGNMGASGQTHWAGPLALTRIDVAARGRIPGRVDWFGLGG